MQFDERLAQTVMTAVFIAKDFAESLDESLSRTAVDAMVLSRIVEVDRFWRRRP